MWHKNIKAQNFLVLLLSLVGIGSSLYFVNSKTTLNDEEKYLVERAVLSEIFQYVVNEQQKNLDYFFIGISGSDPSPTLLDEFKYHEPAVKPISASTMSFGFSAPMVHKNDQTKKGMSFELDEPERKLDGNFKVLTKMYQDKGSSATYEFTLIKRDGVYRVISVDFPSHD